MKKCSVILPGSYDPVTVGHLDIIKRAAEEYESVYAVVFKNPDKEYTFSLSDRVKMLMLATDELDNVLVSYSDGLVIDYMREHGIEKIIKGYRNDADLEYEMAQAQWNLKMGGYETEFIKSTDSLKLVSSTVAREKLLKNEDLTGILPERVIKHIKSL